MARFIIDENMSPAIAALLRDSGHDAIAVSQAGPRMPERDVLAWSVRENRILAALYRLPVIDGPPPAL